MLAVLPIAMPAASRARIEALFRPLLGEQVALAPDGRHVAYTEHVRDELDLIIMALAPPYAKVRIAVADDVGLAFSKEKQHATLRFLRWATSNRLVFAPEEEVIRLGGRAGPKHIAPIMAVDADGKNPRTLVDGPDFVGAFSNPVTGETEERSRFSRIVGFVAGDREHLLVQALGEEIFVSGIGTPGMTPPPPIPAVLPTTLFKVEINTGKSASLDDDFGVGELGVDQQGRSRISYAKPDFSLERPFALVGLTPLKFTEAWLGPLAGKFTLSPQNYFGERAYPLGFDVNPDLLYIASNVGRDTFGVYALDLRAKRRTDLALEDPHVDLAPLEPIYPAPGLVFDEKTGRLAGVRGPGPQSVSVWSDSELAAAQRGFEHQFPRRAVEILEWSDDRDAFLFRVSGGDDPGRYYVFQKSEQHALEILRRAPWLDSADLHPTEPFAFDTAQGAHLTGYVTLPRVVKLNPPPAVICFADGFPPRAQPEFDPQTQVLASMGLVVIRLNHRGTGGFGRRHRDAMLAGIDRVPVEDALATLDWMAARHPIDRKRIATLGSGFGGYLAVRALQLAPQTFRCAVAFDAPLDPAAWLQPPVRLEMGVKVDFAQEVNRAFLSRGGAELTTLSVLEHPERITHPVFLLLDPVRDQTIEAVNRRLRSQLAALKREVELVEVNADFAAGLPDARTRAYAQLEEFLNLNLYDYDVKVGPTREVR